MEFSSFPNFPLVIRNKINNWEILKFKEDDWCKVFNDRKLVFRQGNKSHRETPYWEHLCEKKELTLKSFFECSGQNQDTWLYYDYKYIKDIFPECNKICNGINWVDLKLINFKGQDSTLWIGNEGAHTPCHFDSYGCNFVAQIFGRKLWILMPPDETEVLNPVRVPYEESSIFSSYNFYTPNNDLLKIRRAYKIVLSPGEVLFVPRHWWHYVENLEVAISANIWVPLDVDHESRLEECLVRHFICNICQDLSEEDASKILNPNEYSLLSEPCTFSAVVKCVQNCICHRQEKTTKTKTTNPIFSAFGDETEKVQQFDLRLYIKSKSRLHNYNNPFDRKLSQKLNARVSVAKSLINAYCHPTNIMPIKESLIGSLNLVNDDTFAE